QHEGGHRPREACPHLLRTRCTYARNHLGRGKNEPGDAALDARARHAHLAEIQTGLRRKRFIMTEVEIQRINFFDGQFLKDADFNGLSEYMVHMRRRILYVLFNRSGVLKVSGPDLAVQVPDQSVKKILIKPGMAIGRRDEEMEAKEIILRQEMTIDLTV